MRFFTEAFSAAPLRAAIQAATLRVFLAVAFFTGPLRAALVGATLRVPFLAGTFFTAPLRAVFFVAAFAYRFVLLRSNCQRNGCAQQSSERRDTFAVV